jgi:lipopolysaccharide exporter
MPDAIVSGPILAAVYPKLGKISGDPPAVRKVFMASLSVVATIVTPAFVGLGATADLAIPLVLGDKWLPSVHLIQLLSLAGWLFCIYSAFYTSTPRCLRPVAPATSCALARTSRPRRPSGWPAA